MYSPYTVTPYNEPLHLNIVRKSKANEKFFLNDCEYCLRYMNPSHDMFSLVISCWGSKI